MAVKPLKPKIPPPLLGGKEGENPTEVKPLKPKESKIPNALFNGKEGEKVTEVKLNQLFSFENHPYKVLEDDSLHELMESIKNHGVITPIIVRSKDRGEYEIISGHRRVKACELLEKETIPAFIRKLDDDEAILEMVNTNIYREQILPSEKAFADKMKSEALKRKAGRPVKNYSPVGNNLEEKKTSVEEVSEHLGESKNQIFRYIRLTFLITDFLDLVDNKKLPFQTAVELSHLSHEQQENVLKTMEERNLTPSQEQAVSLKKCSKEGNLSLNVIEGILVPLQAKPKKISVKVETSKYFPDNTPKAEIELVVARLLEEWQANKEKEGQPVPT